MYLQIFAVCYFMAYLHIISMKKINQINVFFFFLTLTIGIGISTNSFAKEDGAPSGNTGSPGDDQTCAHVDCHTGSASNRDGLVFTDVPEVGYLSGINYLVTVTINESGVTKFGFQASPQTITGSKLGDLTLINASHTKLTGGSKYVTHTLSGTSGTNSRTWTFNWTPDDAHGDVTFYVAVNASDDAENASGDKIYTSSVTIKEDPANNPVSVEELNRITFDIISPTTNELVLNIATPVNDEIFINLFDIRGVLISRTNFGNSNGIFKIPLYQYNSGLYFVNVSNEKGSLTKQFIKL